MRVYALIVAAGRGTRAGGDRPKQWQMLQNMRVIDHAINAFESHPLVSGIALVLHADDMSEAPDMRKRGYTVALGGAERNQSVHAGLRILPDCDAVLIHDAARACVSQGIISDVISALDHHDAAAPGVAVTDALWTGALGKVTGKMDRTGLFAAQTPQGFRLNKILQAHETYDGIAADDVAVARAAGLDVAITQGDPDNIKITTPLDFDRAARILEK
ncbi:MAG: 2-C-methyl-D-erythritol 4-phosphate cytidylyltransferase [Sulfitobacter sp.]